MKKIKSGALWLYEKFTLNKINIAFFVFVFLTIAVIPNVVFAETITDMLAGNALGLIFDALLGFMATLLGEILAGVGKLIVLILGALIIPILGYDSFGSSAIVDIGWPLVRDIVNMFVIVILLVIAIQTIVGYSKANWQKQLPRFFLAIVLVNFSRTICLLMIDASQVIMFTFVNALRDIAAGNFMNLFQLNDFTVIGKATAAQTAVTGGIELGQMLVELSVILSLLLVVLGTLIILAIVYLYRIIMLWVLIILSPIAFFMGGVDGVFKEGTGKYGEWWTKFTAALTVGPILTFFLWLALAAASSGPIAVKEGLNFDDTEDIPGFLAEIFVTDKIVSLMMALVLIMVGFKVASTSAAAMGGMAQMLITDGTGKKMVKNALTAPVSLGYRGAKGTAKLGYRGTKAAAGGGIALAKYGGTQAGRQIESRFGTGTDLGKGITGLGKKLASRGGFAGSIVGNRIMDVGNRVESASSASAIAGRDKARKDVDGMSTHRQSAGLDAIKRGANGQIVDPMGQAGKNQQNALLTQLTMDKKLQEQKKKEMDPKDFDHLMSEAMNHVGNHQDQLTDSQKSAFKKAQGGRLRDAVVKDENGVVDTAKTQKDIEKIISDSDFHMGHYSGDDISDKNVRKALQSITRTVTGVDGKKSEQSEWDRLQTTKGVSQDVRQRAKRGDADTALESGDANAIADAIKQGFISADSITGEHIKDGARAEEIARALASQTIDVNTISDNGIRGSVVDAMGRLSEDEDISRNEKAKIDSSRLQAGVDVNQVFNIENNSKVDVDTAKDITNAMSSNPTIIQNFDTQLTEAHNNGATDVTRAISDAMNNVDFKGMAIQSNQANKSERDKISGMLNKYEAVLMAEAGRANNSEARDKELLRYQRKIDLTRRNMG